MKTLMAVVGGFVVSLGMFAGGLAAAIYMLAVEPMGQPGPSVEVADLWTSEPRKIDRNAQNLERIPVQAPAGANRPAEPEIATSDFGSIDTTRTASVETAVLDARQDRLLPPEELDLLADEGAGQEGAGQEGAGQEGAGQLAVLDELTTAHMEWCASRYRSYQPENNSYTSFSGLRQPCVSPFTRDLSQEADAEPALGSPPERGVEAQFIDGSDSYPVFVDEASVQYAVDDTAAYAGSDHESYCFSRYRSYRPEDNTYQPFGGGPRQLCR